MPNRPLLVLMAGADRAALVAQLRHYLNRPPTELAAMLARPGRPPQGRERLAIIASPGEIGASLAFAAERLPSIDRARFVSRPHGLTFTRDAEPGRIAFLFPGQGSEHVGMLAELRRDLPGVAGWFADLDLAAAEQGEAPLSPLLDASTPSEVEASRHALADLERGAQLGTVADLALYEIVTTLGVGADAYLGHSNGEHPAVIAARKPAWSRLELCRWFLAVGRTGRTCAPAPGGERLVAVSAFGHAPLMAVLDRYRGRVFHAMDNCPNQQVIGGHTADVDQAAADIIHAGGIAVPLPFRRAYHTPLFADWSEALGRCYEALPLTSGSRAPIYSCLDAAPLPDDPALCRRAMTAQWTTLVRFRAAVERLHDEGFRTFVEIGPDAKLTAFVEDSLRGRPHVAVSAASSQRGGWAQLARLAAELFTAGCAIDTSVLVTDEEPSLAPEISRAQLAGVHARLLATGRASLARGHASYETSRARRAPRKTQRTLTRTATPFIDDHAFGRRPLADGAYALPVLPFTVGLELIAEAAKATGAPVSEIRDVRASRWLAAVHGELQLEIEAQPDGDGVHVQIRDLSDATPGAAFEGTAVAAPAAATIVVPPLAGARAPVAWDARAFYSRYAFHGPGFQGLTRVTAIGASGIEALVTITDNPGLPIDRLTIDPAMLDCAGQLVAFWLLEDGGLDPTFGIFPYAVARVTVTRPALPPGATVRCRGHIERREQTTDARFIFETEDGHPIAALDGFMQRMISLPRWLAALVFGGASLADAIALLDPKADREWLTGHGGIWARAVAHLCLTPNDLATWQTYSAANPARADWLLARITARS